MAKISLISWRRRENKFPETEAQRRARARERSIDNDRCHGRMAGLGVLAGAPPVELFAFDDDHLMDELSALALLNANSFPDAAEETLDVSTETCVSVGLTADQSCALHTPDFSSLLLRPRPQGASARDPMKVLEMTETFGHGLLHTHSTTHYRRSPWPQ
jgi:hypothetical protein